MDNVANALKTLVGLFHLIELDRDEPERIAVYVQMAKPVLEHLQLATQWPDSAASSEQV